MDSGKGGRNRKSRLAFIAVTPLLSLRHCLPVSSWPGFTWLDPAIHGAPPRRLSGGSDDYPSWLLVTGISTPRKTWMTGSSPAMTKSGNRNHSGQRPELPAMNANRCQNRKYVLGVSSSPDPSRATSEVGGIERFWTT